MSEYCSATDMQNRLTAAGYEWVADRDVSGTGVTAEEEAAYITPAIQDAGVLIDQYISGRTEPSQARGSSNTWLKFRCVDIAVKLALENGARDVPESIKERFDFALDLLKQHDAGNVDIPNYTYEYPQRGPNLSTRGPRVRNPRGC